jgi:iron complex transport system permease protein
MLRADSLVFDYGQQAVLRGVDLRVPSGGLLGILGPNGSGKTTLLKLLAGLLTPARGRVSLDGVDVAGMARTALARRLAVVPQEAELAFDYSVLEVVLMGRYPHLQVFEEEGPGDLVIAREMLAATGTAFLESRTFRALSGGEKQRVTMASALAQFDPEPTSAGTSAMTRVLLLDEPTSSLDLRYQLATADLLTKLNRTQNTTVVVSTHDLNFAARLCRELVLLRDGCIVAAGQTDDVLTSDVIEAVYDVSAEVHQHPLTGRRTVVPLAQRAHMRSVPVVVPGGEDVVPGASVAPSERLSGSRSDVTTARRHRIWLVRVGFGMMAVLACLVAPLVGPTTISLSRVFDTTIPFTDNVDAQIFFIARLPRALAGALVGASLGAAGTVLQALLRNPLATPFTLGVSAGASLGAMLVITLGLPVGLLGGLAVPAASFAGAGGAVAVVYALATIRRQGLSTLILLLAGVTLNSLFSAIILFVQYLADPAQTLQSVRWVMGNLDVGGYGPLMWALAPVTFAFAVFIRLARPLNLLTLGTDSAAARGLDVLRTQRLAFLSSSLATGAAVAVGGPIGFVGIIIPHMVRLLVGADHRLVLPASAGAGAAFLVCCDVGARTLLSPMELPVGVITAMLGGPFFLWLLVRHR